MAVVQLLLTGLFGLLAGLGGVTLQSILQRQDKAADRAFKKKDILRSKAEEIFFEAEQADERAKTALNQAIEHAHGNSSDGSLLPLPDAIRLKTLLQMYFPDSEGIVIKYNAAILAALNESGLAETPKGVGLPTIYKNRLSAVTAMTDATIEFTGAARRLMIDKVRTLI